MKNDGSIHSTKKKKKSSTGAIVSLTKSEKKYQPNICMRKKERESTFWLLLCKYISLLFSFILCEILSFDIILRTGNETKKENELKINSGH